MGTPREHRGLRARRKADGKVVWYLDTTVDGIPLTERAGTDLRAAKALLAKRTAEIWEGKHFPARTGRGRTVDQVIVEYYEKQLKHLKSANTRTYLLKRVGQALGHYVVTKLHISDVEEYRRKRLAETRTIRYKDEKGEWKTKPGRQISASTVNHEVNELMFALDWAVRDRFVSYNPIKGLQVLDQPDPKKVKLDDGKENGYEWRKLYNEANKWLKPIIYLMYREGLRESEACGLRWAWVDLAGRWIHLPEEATKGHKKRDIPLYMDVVAMLLDIEKKGERVFYGKRGEPIESIQKQFTRARDKAGLRREITTHALRRTRLQIWDALNERASCAAAGHADEKVHREHYTDVPMQDLLALVS